MCCGGMNYPNPLGLRISELKPGNEVIILKGEGSPAVPKETATVIWKVDGYSALATNGTAISCMTISDLITTGRQFETYHVSAEALHQWGEILAARKEALGLDLEPDWSVPDPFVSEPE